MDTPDFDALLRERLPAARRARLERIGALAARHGLALYVVGGFVRDLLLGRAPGDFDFVVEGEAPRLAQALRAELGGDVLVHAAFGTATWTGPDGTATDFATSRAETYPHPAALPLVRPAPIAADLDRRDFSINALALRVDAAGWGAWLDPHGGQADLEAGRVRVLHPGSFQDDPTRLFRAVRYEQRLGFQIDPDTAGRVPGAWAALNVLSGDRLRHEFELIFREARTSAMLMRLAGLDILPHVHAALGWDAARAARAAEMASLPFDAWGLEPAEPDACYWALLLDESAPAEAAAVLERINAPRALAQAVQDALGLRARWGRPSELVRRLDELSLQGVVAAYLLRPEARPVLHNYLARWRHVRAETNGADLIALGLPPGPRFSALLWGLRAARLDGEVTDRAGEEAWLRRALGAEES